MTNEATNAAEESETIEKTATEQTESTPTVATTETATPEPAPEQATATSEPPVVNTQTQPEPVPAAATAVMKSTADETTISSDIDFGAILEQFEQEQTVFHPGELVTGTVVGISDRGVLVDFGYKSEGFVPTEEFTSSTGELTVANGDTVEVVIRSIYSGDGAPQLSRTEALGRKVWDEVEKAFQSETPVKCKVIDKTKGGLKVDVNGIEAFMPGSQIDSRPIRGLDTYIGEEFEAKVIKFSRRRNNIVVSRKVLTDVEVNAQKAETLAKIDVGYVIEGTIKNLTDYGAFVDIGGIDGLLHVTDMSWGRVNHPNDLFKSGDHIQVKLLKLDREKDKISLGYKQLLPDPWSTVIDVYPVNSKVTGTISSVTDYGIFAELEPGVEGLVHVSEISWSRRAQSPKRIFHRGQQIEVQVLGVDTVEKRISLGMKQFQENPWETVDLRYPVGSRVHGKVRNITEFGAFVELEEGIDGLVHVSDISWGKKVKHPKDLLTKDQEVEAIVTNIDKRGQRLSLSMKDLTPSAWEGFVATHKPGDVVRGKVSRFTNFGVFVELSEGLEGLCHISELSEERVERVEDVAKIGDDMDFKILRIEPSDQKIGLSHRAVGKDDEPIIDKRQFSSEAKGGMASLGELANLKFGTAAEETPKEEAPKEKKKSKKAAKEEVAAAEESSEAAAQPEEIAATASEAPATETKTSEVAAETPSEDSPAVEETAPELVAEESPVADTVAEETPATTEETTVEESATEATASEESPSEESESKTA
ncbi:MAG: S1 RNA-binding domain-containing protein [Pyrinomonadaceae bacterium]